jgi:hypothetical protein
MNGLVISARIQASPDARPEVDDDTTFILIAVDDDSTPDDLEEPSVSFDITTNSAIMSLPDGVTRLGALLHHISHTLIAGAKLDLTEPIGEAAS